VARGNIVQLGEFGSFRLRIESEGAESEEAVNANSIKSVRPRFTPGKAFQEALDKIAFEKAWRACPGFAEDLSCSHRRQVFLGNKTGLVKGQDRSCRGRRPLLSGEESETCWATRQVWLGRLRAVGTAHS